MSDRRRSLVKTYNEACHSQLYNTLTILIDIILIWWQYFYLQLYVQIANKDVFWTRSSHVQCVREINRACNVFSKLYISLPDHLHTQSVCAISTLFLCGKNNEIITMIKTRLFWVRNKKNEIIWPLCGHCIADPLRDLFIEPMNERFLLTRQICHNHMTTFSVIDVSSKKISRLIC